MASAAKKTIGPAARDKRALILDAALQRFSHYGYRRTSMEDIAQAAGISRAALYLQFKNKEEIFRALARALQEKAIDAAEAAARKTADVAELIERVLHAKLGTFFAMMHGAAHARELLDENNRICGDISTEFRQRHLKLLRRLIEAAARRGALAPAHVGLTPATAAELLVDSAKGIETSGSESLTPALYQRRLAQLVRVVVAGMGTMR